MKTETLKIESTTLAAHSVMPSIRRPITCIVTEETNDLSKGQIVYAISEDGGTAVVAVNMRPSIGEIVEISAGLLLVETED